MTDVAVVILAGGEGRRIGGAKPLREFARERLIDRAIRLAGSWSDVIAVAVRDRTQVELVNAELIEDEAGVEGPLGGLIAGLKFALGRGHELLLTIPADMPFLPGDLLERLAATIGHHHCALASSGGHVHPVCGLWRTSALDRICGYLATERRSLKGFAAINGGIEVDWPAKPDDPFFNINTATDLAEAQDRVTP